MYRAEIQYTIGFGLDKAIIKCDNYKELMNRVDEWIEKKTNKVITVLGKTTTVKVEKTIFSFPSGKKFVKKFA